MGETQMGDNKPLALNASLSLRINSNTKESLENLASDLLTDSGSLVRAILCALTSCSISQMRLIFSILISGKDKRSKVLLREIISGGKQYLKFGGRDPRNPSYDGSEVVSVGEAQ